MSTDHRAEAERIVHGVLNDPEYPNFEEGGEKLVLAGLVHAVLARDEEQAATTADLRDATLSLRRREYAMREAVSTHIAGALASRDADRWKAGRDLAQALDAADCNVHDLIDARLVDDGWDARSAWKAPAGSGGWIGYAAAKAAPDRDPWTPAPDITAQVPEPVRRVIAGHLAEMLLDRDENAQKWARGIAYELKRAGADLTDAIKQRIHDLTLGTDPSEPPF